MPDCPFFELPNQKREHIEYAESEFEEMGADLDDSKVVFVGGTLYAHDYKARHPGADVTAVEVDPIAAYTQRFAGHQLEEGTDPKQVVEYLFNFSREEQEGESTIISQDEYVEIKEAHKDFVEDEEVDTPVEMASNVVLREQLERVLDSLNEREREVLKLRFGLEDGYSRTLEEVGNIFEVTRERIRQIESKALDKLRQPSRTKELRDYLE